MRTALAMTLVLAFSTGAWAAGGGGGGSGGGAGAGGSGGSGSAVKTCNSGYVYDKKKKKCVTKTSAGIPDSDLLEQGWVLAKSGHLEEGRELFALVADHPKANPEALNGLGYTNRKLGNFDIAIMYYKRSLAIDPNYLDAREYLGEGYVTAGKLDLAKEQLAEIAKRGGTNIEQFAELSEAIDDAVKSAAAQ
jgi:tetratricopeptide (TPR) repeat protein